MCIPTHQLLSVARIDGIAKSTASKYRISDSIFMLAGINIPYKLLNISPGFIFVHIRIFHGHKPTGGLIYGRHLMLVIFIAQVSIYRERKGI